MERVADIREPETISRPITQRISRLLDVTAAAYFGKPAQLSAADAVIGLGSRSVPAVNALGPGGSDETRLARSSIITYVRGAVDDVAKSPCLPRINSRFGFLSGSPYLYFLQDGF